MAEIVTSYPLPPLYDPWLRPVGDTGAIEKRLGQIEERLSRIEAELSKNQPKE